MADKIDIGSVSYVLGILSIVFAFFSPFVGLILGIIGYSQSRTAGHAKAKKLNLTGIVISIIFIIISIVAIIYSVKTGVTNFFPSI